MKSTNKQTGWTAESIAEAQQRYQEGLMLRLQPIETTQLEKTGWQPGFEKIYAHLAESDGILSSTSISSIVKH